jgi:peptide/nickel transport system permease protein
VEADQEHTPDLKPPAAPVRALMALLRLLRAVALLRESRIGMVGAGLVAFWVIMALAAPLLSPFPPNATLVPLTLPGTPYEGGGTFWLGTDHIGRDVLSRVIWGSRTVLIYAPLATLCAYGVGILLGLAAGYHRGWVDELLSRFSDFVLSFPVLVLYILIIATFGSSPLNIILAVTFASAPGVMRIVRGLTLGLRDREYIAAAQMRGEGGWYIMFVEILPNVRGPLVVDACLRLGYVTITIGVLGFLGLGLPPPDPDWGGMINETRVMAMAFPHMALFPCLAISSLVLGLNLVADGIREVSLNA